MENLLLTENKMIIFVKGRFFDLIENSQNIHQILRISGLFVEKWL